MAVVLTAQREAMSSSNFAVPGKRKLLVHDATHAKLAWTLVNKAANLSEDERAVARRRIKSALDGHGFDTTKLTAGYCDACDRLECACGSEQHTTHNEGQTGMASVFGYPTKSDPTVPKKANVSVWTDAVEKMSINEQVALSNFIGDLSMVDAYQLSTALTAIVGKQLLSNQLMVKNASSAPNQVRCFFSDKVQVREGKVRIPIARIGTFVHQRYGIVDFKQSDFDDMTRNFSSDETGFPPYLRYGHAKYPDAVDAEPKIANLEKLEQDGDILYGVYKPVKGHEDVVKKVEDGEYEFSSAELTRYAISKRDGRPIGTLLTAHALTNAPFVPDLPRNQALSEGAAGTPSGGFIYLNLSHQEGAPTMNPNEFLSTMDAQLELLSVSSDARVKMRSVMASALSDAGVPDVTSKTAGQPGPVYSGGGEGGKQQAANMNPDQPTKEEGVVKKTAGKPSEVYSDGEDSEELSDSDHLGMVGELLSMFGKMLGKKPRKGGKPNPFAKKDEEKGADEKNSTGAADVAQNLSSKAATIDPITAPIQAQKLSATPNEGDTDMKPEEVKAAIAEALNGVKQEFSTQLAEKDQTIETLKTALTAVQNHTQQFSLNAERGRVEARANRLVQDGVAPAMVNAALALASDPAFAGQQIKLSEGAAPVNAVDALLDMLEKTPQEYRLSYGQIGQQLSAGADNVNDDPYAEIITRVKTSGQ